MDTKVKGIVLASKDYKENDKLLWLLTPIGKLTVLAKGVKKPKAKLKPATMPFCFGEYLLTNKGGEIYTLTSCEVIDSFFDITSDYDSFLIGCKMLDIAGKIVNEENGLDIMLLLLKLLNLVAYVDLNDYVVFVKYLTEILSNIGFRLNLDKCSKCGEKFLTKVYLDTDTGEVLCPSCKTSSSVDITINEYTIIRLICKTDFDNLKQLKFDETVLKNISKILIKNIANKLNVVIKNLWVFLLLFLFLKFLKKNKK